MREIWRDIKDFEGIYQVSNLGRVRSLARWIKRKDGKTIYRKGRILKPQTGSGYQTVYFRVGNKQKWFYVHRLVAEAFIPNPDNLPQVNHINENRMDNRVENLEWCSQRYNINYGTAIERQIKTKIALGFYKDYTGWKEDDIIEDRKKRQKKYYQDNKERIIAKSLENYYKKKVS